MTRTGRREKMRSYMILCEIPAEYFVKARNVTEAVEAFEHAWPDQFVEKPLGREMIIEILDSKRKVVLIPKRKRNEYRRNPQ
jgi:hypothetical protein